MKRYPDWHARMHEYLKEAKKKEFVWGEHDCAHFAVGAVRAMTGHDLAYAIPQYESPISAKKAVYKAGYRNLLLMVGSLLEKTDNPNEGDIALVALEVNELALGVMGRGCVYCLNPVKGFWVSFDPPEQVFKVPF